MQRSWLYKVECKIEKFSILNPWLVALQWSLIDDFVGFVNCHRKKNCDNCLRPQINEYQSAIHLNITATSSYVLPVLWPTAHISIYFCFDLDVFIDFRLLDPISHCKYLYVPTFLFILINVYTHIFINRHWSNRGKRIYYINLATATDN